MEKEKKVLTEARLKKWTLNVFLVFAIAYGLLFLFSLISKFEIYSDSYLLIFLLIDAIVIQWTIFMCVLCITGNLYSKYSRLSIFKPILTFLPTVLIVIYLILFFTVPALKDRYDIDANNFFKALAYYFMFLVIASCLLFVATNVIKRIKEREKKPKKEKKVLEVSKDDDESEMNIFPDLVEIDRQYKENKITPNHFDKVSLKQLCEGFNTYLQDNKMYYTMDTIRSFISGMACSRFIILEGLSGTGKTSLPKFFAEYVNCLSCFTPVQASWKDRSDILGYYNDFSKKFKETPFLRTLYNASYQNNEINIMVLDEMNLSRVEYYFADFLSVLELDKDKWEIELMPSSTKGELPKKFVNGCCVKIPDNTWFIGTANKDDSTFTITDKVYDRASVIDFSSRNEPTNNNMHAKSIHISSTELLQLFEESIDNSVANIPSKEYDRFNKLSEFMLDKFDINFGNRILNQIKKFVPVFVSCGGTISKAIDIMFARKILRKLDGRFDEGLKSNLIKLEALINDLYGANEFSCSIEVIAKLKRKLI